MNKIAFCFVLAVMVAVSAFSMAPVQFKGTIIFLGNDSIEIKKGKSEVSLQLTQNSKIIYHGKETDRRFLQICQKVIASYVSADGKKELTKLEIVKDSYCIR